MQTAGISQMNEITPELVAQVATRLFQGTPTNLPSIPQSFVGTSPPVAMPGSPTMPSAFPAPMVGDPRGSLPQGVAGLTAVPLATGLGLPLSAPVPLTGVPHPSLVPLTSPQPPSSPEAASFPPQVPHPGSHLPFSSTVMPYGVIPSPTEAPSFPSVGGPVSGEVPTQGGPVSLSHSWKQAFGGPRLSTSTFPSQTPTLPQLQPVEFPASPASAPPEPLGIAGFVQRVRTMSYRSDTGLCHDRPLTAGEPTADVHAPFSQKGPRPFDVEQIRRDFPALHQYVHGHPLAWFDNAATTQKPQAVIDAIAQYYARDNSNIHRGAHTLAARSTDAFEGARKKIQEFLGASTPDEIILVRGTTEGINLVAQTYGRKFFQPGDEIILSTLEHHANIVPWQLIAQQTGAVIRVIPVNDRGEIILERYQALLGPKTRFVALTHASNSLGTVLPIADMIHSAKRFGAHVLIDGAQTVAHVPVNVQELGCDFFVFSGHKIFGPTGIGAVFGRKELLDVLPPWQGGGNMIKDVTFEETQYNGPPARFEAGTPNIADTIGLGAALDYVQNIGLKNIAKYEHELLDYATAQLTSIPHVRLIGTAREKIGVLSFVIPNRRSEDIGRLLDQEGIAVRSGHHCSQPSLRRFGVETTVRPSLAFYNTFGEIDRLANAIRRITSRGD